MVALVAFVAAGPASDAGAASFVTVAVLAAAESDSVQQRLRGDQRVESSQERGITVDWPASRIRQQINRSDSRATGSWLGHGQLRDGYCRIARIAGVVQTGRCNPRNQFLFFAVV